MSEAERQGEQGEPIKRLYVEMDGVMARLRRGDIVNLFVGAKCIAELEGGKS